MDRITLQRDLKQYRKSLGNAEHELEQYRIQLRDYTQKVKERHVAESVREEMDDLRSQLQEKDALIAALHQDREDENGAAVANGEVERLQDDIGDLEADIREREGIIQGKDEELDALHERVQALESEQAGDDDRQTVEEQQEELEALRDEVEAATLARNEEIAKLREDLRASERARVEELNSVKKSKELEIEKSRNELGKFRQEHDDEIAALEDRLRIAESGGNNRVQLLQQALDDAREDTKRVRRDKDGEIHELHSKLQSAQTIKEEMEQYKRQSSSHQEELNRRKKDEATSEGERRSLLNDNQRQTQEIQSLKQRVNDLERDLQDAENVRRRLQQKEHELSPLRRTAEERRVALQELSSLQEVIREQTGELKRLRVTADERSKLQAEVEQLRSKLRRCESELELLQKVADEPDSQLEIVQKVVNDRNTEVDGLRDKIEKLKRLVEEVQKTANNRLQSMNDLKKEIDKNKTLHEEEIQVLDMALEDMQEEKDQLQKQVKSMAGRAKEQDAGRGVSQSLQKQISELRVENLTLESESQKAADRLSAMEADKSFFSSKVQQLTDQLDKARLVARSKQVSGQGLQELQDMVKNSELEAENLRVELAKKEQQVAEEIKVRRTNRREESEARDKMADAEKRHAGELRGLAKQIQYLKAKCVREEGLREALAYSKQYFLMQIELYNEWYVPPFSPRSHIPIIIRLFRPLHPDLPSCPAPTDYFTTPGLNTNHHSRNSNKVDLRLIGEMGISASRWQPRRKPSLRVVGFLVLASVRVRRLQKEWATNVKLHSALQRKYEQVRHQSRLTRQK